MRTIEVIDKHLAKRFLELPHDLYKDDPQWVCPLLDDIESIFDPQKNNFFSFGKCVRWILVNDSGKTIGRIAAFINEKKAYNETVPTGGCGFFECINDQGAANALFDQAKSWLTTHGMQAMNGPINFGETDTWWGLLVEGFTGPYYGMNYNPPYYRSLFENYGFTVRFEQISNRIDVKKGMPDRVKKIANWVQKRNGFIIKSLDTSNIAKYASDFKEVYNDAWINFENFTPVVDETIAETIRKIKPIMDPNLILFAYTDKEEPVSFVMILPDTNELIKNLKGKLDLLGKIKFLWNKMTIKHKRMRCVIMGTKQKYQNHGIESCLFMKLQEYTHSFDQYEELELSWVGDFNDKMMALHENIGATFAKKHITYHRAF
jgi:hypothetical protein